MSCVHHFFYIEIFFFLVAAEVVTYTFYFSSSVIITRTADYKTLVKPNDVVGFANGTAYIIVYRHSDGFLFIIIIIIDTYRETKRDHVQS